MLNFWYQNSVPQNGQCLIILSDTGSHGLVSSFRFFPSVPEKNFDMQYNNFHPVHKNHRGGLCAMLSLQMYTCDPIGHPLGLNLGLLVQWVGFLWKRYFVITALPCDFDDHNNDGDEDEITPLSNSWLSPERLTSARANHKEFRKKFQLCRWYIYYDEVSVCLCVTKNDHFLLGVSCNHLNPP